jgi:hypothetical protein
METAACTSTIRSTHPSETQILYSDNSVKNAMAIRSVTGSAGVMMRMPTHRVRVGEPTQKGREFAILVRPQNKCQ